MANKKKYPYYVQIIGTERLVKSLDTKYVARIGVDTQVSILMTQEGVVDVSKEFISDKEFKEYNKFIKITEEEFKNQLDRAFRSIMSKLV